VAEQPTSRAIKEFLGESEEIIEKLNLDLVTLADGVENGEVDPELLNSIFRGAHSLKGISGMFGFDDISTLSHHMESLLDSLRLGKVALSGSLVEVLFEALETLSRLVHGKGEAEEYSLDLAPVLARIEGVLGGGAGEKGNLLAGLNIDRSILNVLTEYEEHRLLENLKKARNLLNVKISFSLASFDQDLAELTDILKKTGEVISTLPCAGDAADRIGFQLLYGTSASVEEIFSAVGREDAVVELLSAKAVATAPRAAEETADTEGQESGTTSMRSISRTVRVDIDKLDSLMNVVGELVLSKGAIAAVAERARGGGAGEMAAELQKSLRVLERRLDELQKGVMEVRMVPVVLRHPSVLMAAS
jgi:two-component system chemotaxis sensor kinase CheA